MCPFRRSSPHSLEKKLVCATTGFTNDTGLCGMVELIEDALLDLSKESQGTTCSGSLQSQSASTSLTGESGHRTVQQCTCLTQAFSEACLSSGLVSRLPCIMCAKFCRQGLTEGPTCCSPIKTG